MAEIRLHAINARLMSLASFLNPLLHIMGNRLDRFDCVGRKESDSGAVIWYLKIRNAAHMSEGSRSVSNNRIRKSCKS